MPSVGRMTHKGIKKKVFLPQRARRLNTNMCTTNRETGPWPLQDRILLLPQSLYVPTSKNALLLPPATHLSFLTLLNGTSVLSSRKKSNNLRSNQ